MHLQYLTESIHLLPNCSIMTLSGGGVLQPGQLLPKPAKTLHLQHRQSHAVFGLFEKIPSLGLV